MAGFFESASLFDNGPGGFGPEPLATLIASGQNLLQADGDGATLLHHACEQGHLDAVVMLVEAGAALEALARDGRTPLHMACVMAGSDHARGTGHVECAKYLQAQGAVTSTQDMYGRTALSYLPHEAKRVGLNVPSCDGGGAVWAITQVTPKSAVREGSVAQAGQIQLGNA